MSLFKKLKIVIIIIIIIIIIITHKINVYFSNCLGYLSLSRIDSYYQILAITVNPTLRTPA